MSEKNARLARNEDGAVPCDDRTNIELLSAIARRPESSESQIVCGTTAFSSMAACADASNLNRNLLKAELEKMAAAIMQTQREIAGIKPNVAGANRVASASEELSMVACTTEVAATNILSIAERLQQIEVELAARGATTPLRAEIGTLATSLMIACSFQDVTGQRMQKAANALQFIEKHINGLIDIWGVAEPGDGDAADASDPDAGLLNGPSRNGEGVTQEEIDRLIND